MNIKEMKENIFKNNDVNVEYEYIKVSDVHTPIQIFLSLQEILKKHNMNILKLIYDIADLKNDNELTKKLENTIEYIKKLTDGQVKELVPIQMLSEIVGVEPKDFNYNDDIKKAIVKMKINEINKKDNSENLKLLENLMKLYYELFYELTQGSNNIKEIFDVVKFEMFNTIDEDIDIEKIFNDEIKENKNLDINIITIPHQNTELNIKHSIENENYGIISIPFALGEKLNIVSFHSLVEAGLIQNNSKYVNLPLFSQIVDDRYSEDFDVILQLTNKMISTEEKTNSEKDNYELIKLTYKDLKKIIYNYFYKIYEESIENHKEYQDELNEITEKVLNLFKRLDLIYQFKNSIINKEKLNSHYKLLIKNINHICSVKPKEHVELLEMTTEIDDKEKKPITKEEYIILKTKKSIDETYKIFENLEKSIEIELPYEIYKHTSKELEQKNLNTLNINTSIIQDIINNSDKPLNIVSSPGTGKTSTIKKMLKIFGKPYIFFSSAETSDPTVLKKLTGNGHVELYGGTTVKFDSAEKFIEKLGIKIPIIIDEVDSLYMTLKNTGISTKVLNELLTNKKVPLIMTSNIPLTSLDIDPSVLRRIEEKIMDETNFENKEEIAKEIVEIITKKTVDTVDKVDKYIFYLNKKYKKLISFVIDNDNIFKKNILTPIDIKSNHFLHKNDLSFDKYILHIQQTFEPLIQRINLYFKTTNTIDIDNNLSLINKTEKETLKKLQREYLKDLKQIKTKIGKEIDFISFMDEIIKNKYKQENILIIGEIISDINKHIRKEIQGISNYENIIDIGPESINVPKITYGLLNRIIEKGLLSQMLTNDKIIFIDELLKEIIQITHFTNPEYLEGIFEKINKKMKNRKNIKYRNNWGF